MPTFIQVPMAINFTENSHAYGNQGAYVYWELKSTWYYTMGMYTRYELQETHLFSCFLVYG